jgi:hypothetical protein
MLHLSLLWMHISRRQAALNAIAAVAAGVVAGDVETEVLDFKEEARTVVAGGRRAAIGAQHEPAAQALAAEVACMAMSERGGAIVVGVNDCAAGSAAFVAASWTWSGCAGAYMP